MVCPWFPCGLYRTPLSLAILAVQFLRCASHGGDEIGQVQLRDVARFNYVAAADENPWLQQLDLEDGKADESWRIHENTMLG